MEPKHCRFVAVSLLVVVFCALAQVTAKRIAEKKCEEYRDVPSLEPRGPIIGGVVVPAQKYTHQAWLGYANPNDTEAKIEFKCGGSLISNRYVLTAAHCGRSQWPTLVRLGQHDLLDDTEFYKDFEVLNVTKHVNYRVDRSYNDIALIQLADKVRAKGIRPACLWTNLRFNMSSVVATGFGRTSNGDVQLSSQLMEVELDVLNRSKCEEKFQYSKRFRNGIITPKQLCVGSLVGGKDTCQGDSGSPLLVAVTTDAYHIVAVTSVGHFECAVGNSAAVYTLVAGYLNWIERIVWPDDFKKKF